MSDITPDEYRKRAELLKTARQLLTQDYIARRAEGHKQWIASSETMWRTNGALLPYPVGSLYPTEAEIVAKALELYNLSVAPQPQPAAPAAPAVTTSIPLPEAPPASAATFNDPAVTPNDVIQQLEAVYTRGNITLPSSPQASTVSPWEEMLNSTPVITEVAVEPTVEPTEPVQPSVDVIPEEVIKEISPEIVALEPEAATTETEVKPPKDSLLRSVLSSWLQKNKGNSQ